MARPANQREAGHKTRELLARTLRGTRKATLHTHLERAERIGQTIWRHWQVGPYQWQAKHVRWYLDTQTRALAPGTRYRYWLTVRALLCALGRYDDWLVYLDGAWLRPTGQAGALKIGRPPALPQPVPRRRAPDSEDAADHEDAPPP